MELKIGIIVDKMNTEKNIESGSSDKQKNITAKKVKTVLSKKYKFTRITADEMIMQKLKDNPIDLAFNLSTGISGESRQSQIPAILEMLDIPYVGSGVLTHAMALNKVVAKKIFLYHGIPTPKFQAFRSGKETVDKNLTYPIIVKPACEGSGFGIHKDSVVFNEKDLYKKIGELLAKYQPPVLAEEFIEGREFTVGIIGNGKEKTILPIMEIDFKNIPEEYGKFYSFEVKNDFGDKTGYYCPAPLKEELADSIKSCASRAFDSLGCRDLARIDIRLKDKKPYIIEINSLPGLQPIHSDLPKMADAVGMTYQTLILKILEEAVKRIKNKKIIKRGGIV